MHHGPECHLIIFVLDFLDTQPTEVVGQESSNKVLFPKSESSGDIKESTNQKQTEHLTKSPTGMVIICFLNTGHDVLLEYGRWYWVLKVLIVVIGKCLKCHGPGACERLLSMMWIHWQVG